MAIKITHDDYRHPYRGRPFDELPVMRHTRAYIVTTLVIATVAASMALASVAFLFGM